MKSFKIYCLALIALVVLPASAQDEDFQLMRWHGGTVSADIQLGFNFAGAGIGNGTFGGVLSPRVTSGAASLFSNPAELGLLRQRQVTFGSKFALGTGTLGLQGSSLLPPEDIAKNTDDFLSDLSFPEGGTPIYTEANDIGAAQVGQLSSFALALPVHKRLTLAMGLHYPLDLSLGLRVSGLEAFLDAAQESGDQTIGINMLMNVNAALDLNLRMNTLSFGAGGQLLNGGFGSLSAGVSMNRYLVSHALGASVNPEAGIVLSGSQEYFFNDAGDPNLNAATNETNAFYWRAKGHYTDSAWGMRAGLVYTLPLRGWSLSVAYNKMPAFELADAQAFAEGYLPSFIDTDAIGEEDENGEARDVLLLDAFNLAKPNLTQATDDSLGQVLGFQMPSTLTAGLDVGLGPHTLALNYIHYLNGFSYEGVYGKPGADLADNTFALRKEFTSGVRFGLDFKFPDRLRGGAWALVPIRLLFLDIDGLLLQALGKHTGYKNPHYRFGGGLSIGPASLEGRLASLDDDLGAALDGPLPGGFSLGRQYTVFNDLDVGVMVFSVPDMLFRVSMAYNFR